MGKGDSSSGNEPKPGKKPVDLTATLYDELHRMAALRMSRQKDPQTLQATALVHEAWLRMGGDEQPEWKDRRHFIATAATAMRSILVNRARHRQALRHGGGQHRVDLDAWNWELQDPASTGNQDEQILELNEWMELLEQSNPEAVEILQLRYFGGLKVSELAETLGLSKRTVERRLAFACALLGEAAESNQLS